MAPGLIDLVGELSTRSDGGTMNGGPGGAPSAGGKRRET